MKRSLLGLAFLSVTSCADTGHGSLVVRVSGEGPAVAGYPYDDGSEIIGFVDGWSLTYTHVFVSLERFRLASEDGSDAGLAVDGVIADLHLGDAIAWNLPSVGARRWDRLAYDLAVPDADARLLDGVAQADADRMRTSGYAVLVEGVATDGADTIPFSFGIPDEVRAYDCESGVDGTMGTSVRVNGVSSVELTIHLDHFFLDSIAAAEPSMRFEALAARAGADQMLTLDDLLTVPVTDIRDRDGAFILVDGGVLVYDPGPFPLDANRSLASYVRANAITLGHLDGEGHCRYVAATP